MRGISCAVLAAMLASVAAPVMASTIIREYEATYYTYVYTPSADATWYVYAEDDADNVVELGPIVRMPRILIYMGLLGVYDDQLAGRVVSFNDIYDDYANGDSYDWFTRPPVPAGDIGSIPYIYGYSFYEFEDEGGTYTDGGDPITLGTVEFDDEMNIVSWELVVGGNDYCYTSKLLGIASGSEGCNDYGSGGIPEITGGTLLQYFSNGAGTWERTEYAAYLIQEIADEQGEVYEAWYTFIPRSTGDTTPDPGSEQPSSVPLPASALLLLSGLGALGAGRVWRRRRVAH